MFCGHLINARFKVTYICVPSWTCMYLYVPKVVFYVIYAFM